MLDSKLVESIQSLASGERAEFASFLDSRFFQREFSIQQLKKFYDLLCECIAKPPKDGLPKEVVHQAIFDPKPFAENRVDRLMFELNRLLKTFLLVKNYLREENEVQQTLDWSKLQRHKGTDLKFEKQFQKIKEEVRQKIKSSAETYFEEYLIAKEEHEWKAIFNKAKGDLGLPEAIETLDFYYYAERLEMLNKFLVQQRVSSVETPEIIRMSMEDFSVPQYYLEKSPILLITTNIHELFKDAQPNSDGVKKLMTLLKVYEGDLPPKLLAQFYAYLRNFCVMLIDSGKVEFDLMLHEIQQDNLKRGYFYYDGRIPPNAFLNITQHAIRANNLAWAWEFIRAHKDIITGENESQEFYRMNEALCFFAEKKFEDALAVIPFGSTYSSYHLMARRLELKIYYELQSEVLPSKIDAYKMFVNRVGNKSLSRNLSEMLTNFGNFVHQLSLSIPGDKKRSEQLIRRIQEKKLVGERAWLLEKARELGEKR